MSYGKKSIDIVRERIKERIEEGAKTPEEKRLLDDLSKDMNKDYFFFINCPGLTAARIFAMLGFEVNQALELYSDLLSRENIRKYQIYRREQKNHRIVKLVNEVLNRKNRDDNVTENH